MDGNSSVDALRRPCRRLKRHHDRLVSGNRVSQHSDAFDLDHVAVHERGLRLDADHHHYRIARQLAEVSDVAGKRQLGNVPRDRVKTDSVVPGGHITGDRFGCRQRDISDRRVFRPSLGGIV